MLGPPAWSIYAGKLAAVDRALVAAGSTVTRNVEPRMIVMGCPARPVRPVPVEQLLENQGWVDA